MASSERPRERLCQAGPQALKTSELIAILLRTGLQGKSAIALGEELVAKYPSLDALCRTSVQELSRIRGIGMAKAVQLKAAFELATRLSQSIRHTLPMDNPESIVRLLSDEMRQLPHESLRVLSLNTKLHLIASTEVSRGTLNETILHPRDIFRAAIEHNAAAIVVVHNHPSGDPHPSTADHTATMKLVEASKLLQIELLDHLILGTPTFNQPKSYFSFKEAGYI